MITKTCDKCREEKKLDDFHKLVKSADGYRSTCKICACAIARKYNADHKEEIAAKKKKFQVEHKEEIAFKKKIFYEANKDRLNAISRDYYENNKEDRKSKMRVYNSVNKEIRNEKNKEYYKNNSERIKESVKKYRLENKDKISEYKKVYGINNKEHLNSYKHEHYIKKYANNEETKLKKKEYEIAHKKANRDYWRAKYARDRKDRRNAIVSWANNFFIEEIYSLAVLRTELTGILHHVDHIVPIKSQKVCGLHVETNMQIITATENRAKNNRYWPDMP